MGLEGHIRRRHLLEWVIPAWTFVLAWLLFVSTGAIARDPDLLESLSQFALVTEEQPGRDWLFEILFGVFFLTVAGLPTGFLIHQLYYYFRWNSPFARTGFLTGGRLAELQLVLDRATLDIVLDRKADHKRVWTALAPHLRRSMKAQEERGDETRTRRLLNYMHLLGAVYLAVVMAFSVYLYVEYRVKHPDSHSDVTFYAVVVFTILVNALATAKLHVYDIMRRGSHGVIGRRILRGHHPAELLILFGTISLLGVWPVAEVNIKIIAAGVLTLLAVLWVGTHSTNRRYVLMTLAAGIVTAGASHHLINVANTVEMDYGAALASLVFAILTVALLENRHTTKMTIVEIYASSLRQWVDADRNRAMVLSALAAHSTSDGSTNLAGPIV